MMEEYSYSEGYGNGYVDALNHVKEYLMDELDWIKSGTGKPVPTDYYIGELISHVESWIDNWGAVNV